MFIKFVQTLLLAAFVFEEAAGISNENGWIPLTKEEVLHNINRPPDTRRSYIDQNPANYNYNQYEDFRVLSDKAIKMIEPKIFQKIEHEIMVASSENVKAKCINPVCVEPLKTDLKINNAMNHSERQQNSVKIDKRKGKRFLEGYPELKNDNALASADNILFGKQFEAQITINNGNRKNYKVTEDINDAIDSREEELSGYNYRIPETSSKNPIDYEPSLKLEDLLSKYDMKLGTKLSNYIISRQPNIKTPSFMLIPISNKNPIGINNMNHFPIDPAVAVLLSNYGYYYPGLYGIKSKYRNLYGYLASNNIHNNKPFGSYKIFSDTDSSY